MKYLCIITAIVCLAACSSKNKIPGDVLKPDEMGTILFEANIAEEFVASYVAKDTTKNKDVALQEEYQKIYLLHGITEEQFKKSYAFYKAHTGIFKVLMDSLNARAQRRRNDLYKMPL